MAHTFGVCNSSPSVVAKLLIDKGIVETAGDIAIVPVGKTLAHKVPTRYFIFIVSLSDLIRNLKVLNSANYKECAVFIFASPIRLSELTGVTYLDMMIDPAAKGFGFKLTYNIDLVKYRANMRQSDEKQKQIARDSREHLTILTDSVKEGSLLTPLMTFIYSLPNATLQTPVKIAVAKIISKGLPLTQLDKLIASTSDYVISEKAKSKLYNILQSDVGERYMSAFKQYHQTKKKKGSISLASIANKFNVSDYEIRYLLSVLEAVPK